LVTGPTGSGKTTTLYAALDSIRKQNVKTITVEDPVEYRIEGTEQIQVNPQTGYTFATALRHILRHDPDVILIGEIRDRETAKIAIESALTGHLVLSTLHTNNAASTVTRLLEMGIEPYLVSSTLLGVVAQRLVRCNCQRCIAEEDVAESIRRVLGVTRTEQFYRGHGCEYCNQTGYSGRIAAYELLPVTVNMRKHMMNGATSESIYKQAIRDNMIPLTENALARARDKTTSLAEVYRVRL
jgi:type IV pilus assembly protein PilB